MLQLPECAEFIRKSAQIGDASIHCEIIALFSSLTQSPLPEEIEINLFAQCFEDLVSPTKFFGLPEVGELGQLGGLETEEELESLRRLKFIFDLLYVCLSQNSFIPFAPDMVTKVIEILENLNFSEPGLLAWSAALSVLPELVFVPRIKHKPGECSPHFKKSYLDPCPRCFSKITQCPFFCTACSL